MKILNGVDDGSICLHFDIDARPQFPAEFKNHKIVGKFIYISGGEKNLWYKDMILTLTHKVI